MKIKCADGMVFEGAKPTEIVLKMKHEMFSQPARKTEFMEGVRQSLISMDPVAEIDVSSAQKFLESLQEAGFVEFLDDNSERTDSA